MPTPLDYFTKSSCGNRSFNEAYDLLRALARLLEHLPIDEREKFTGRLVEYGAPLIGVTTIWGWLDGIPDPAGPVVMLTNPKRGGARPRKTMTTTIN